MAGKGSNPRNCFSKEFKNNYDDINWGHKPKSWSEFSDKFYEDNREILEKNAKTLEELYNLKDVINNDNI